MIYEIPEEQMLELELAYLQRRIETISVYGQRRKVFEKRIVHIKKELIQYNYSKRITKFK